MGQKGLIVLFEHELPLNTLTIKHESRLSSPNITISKWPCSFSVTSWPDQHCWGFGQPVQQYGAWSPRALGQLTYNNDWQRFQVCASSWALQRCLGSLRVERGRFGCFGLNMIQSLALWSLRHDQTSCGLVVGCSCLHGETMSEVSGWRQHRRTPHSLQAPNRFRSLSQRITTCSMDFQRKPTRCLQLGSSQALPSDQIMFLYVPFRVLPFDYW